MAIEDEQGVYRLSETPGKPHPHCYCYLTAAGIPTLEELEAALANGDFDTTDSKFSEDPDFNLRLRNESGSPWRPVMSSKDALSWASGSAISGEMLHGTTPEAAASIREQGFRLDETKFGRMFGNGVYLTENEGTAYQYSGGEILKTRVNVKNPITADDIWADPKFLGILDEANKIHPNDILKETAAALSMYAERMGNDAIMKMRAGKIDELIVLDPRNVVVVHED